MKTKKIIKKTISYPYETEEKAKEDLQIILKSINNAKNIKIVNTASWYYYEYDTEFEIYYQGNENVA